MIIEAARRHKILQRWHHRLAVAHKGCLRWGLPALLLCGPLYWLSTAVFSAADGEFRRIAGENK